MRAYLFNSLPRRAKMNIYAKAIARLLGNIGSNPAPSKRDFPKRSSLIEITNACNLNCVMCNTKLSKRPIGFMSPALFETVLRRLAEAGIKTVGLHTVGEPFMYKNMEAILEIAGRYEFHVQLSTNGQFPERIEPLYRKFPRLADCYRFSIDGATPKTYEFIRRGASFDKLIKALEVIHKINGGKRSARIRLSIDSILSMTNIYELPLFFKNYGKYCRPDDINFFLVNGLSPDPAYFRKEFPFPNLIRSNVPCYMPFEEIYFTYGGKATLCCRDYEEELVIGDIKEETVLELWNGKFAEAIREKHLNGAKMDIASCKNCYGPPGFISGAVNAYIHFLMLKEPRLGEGEFGDKVVAHLKGLDSAMQKTGAKINFDCQKSALLIS